jgi:hypothetical protein
MPYVYRDQRVQLGCGTLLVIALIVALFSSSGTKDLEREVGGLRSEVGEIKRLIQEQSAEIRQLREKLSAPAPKAVDEKGNE